MAPQEHLEVGNEQFSSCGPWTLYDRHRETRESPQPLPGYRRHNGCWMAGNASVDFMIHEDFKLVATVGVSIQYPV